jgi:choline dehydrogenase-like flavoprotein
MIINNINQIQNELFEVIIIGSGPAGISTALELEEKKIKTLIIEAGSLDYNEKTLEFLNGEIIGDKHDDLSVTRLRQFGGTSGLWGGNCNLFEDYQFAEWPIKKNDLDIYLKKSKNILDIKKEFYHEDFNEHFNQFNLPWSKTRFKNKFYDKIKKSNYISLLLNTVFM